jgi:hypothetical protein
MTEEENATTEMKFILLVGSLMMLFSIGYYIYHNSSTNDTQPVQYSSETINNPTNPVGMNVNIGDNQPQMKDLTLPSGFHHLKWGDTIAKLNHPELVTDNENNFEVAGYIVDTQMHEVPQCYIQRGENLKLGMNRIDEVVYCFTNKQLSEVQIYRKVAYEKGYNENNCNSLDCLADKDQTWNNLFVDYITKTYGTTPLSENEDYPTVSPKTWQDNSGKNIYLKMDGFNMFAIGTDYYDNQSAQAITMGLAKCNHTSAEGNSE